MFLVLLKQPVIFFKNIELRLNIIIKVIEKVADLKLKIKYYISFNKIKNNSVFINIVPNNLGELILAIGESFTNDAAVAKIKN